VLAVSLELFFFFCILGPGVLTGNVLSFFKFLATFYIYTFFLGAKNFLKRRKIFFFFFKLCIEIRLFFPATTLFTPNSSSFGLSFLWLILFWNSDLNFCGQYGL